MKKPSTSANMLLLFGAFVLCCVRADAEAVPALENINSQAELEKAIVTLDTTFSLPTTSTICKNSHHSLPTAWSFITIRGVTLGKEALTEAIKKNICFRPWAPAPTVYRAYRIATSNSQCIDKIRLLASRSIA